MFPPRGSYRRFETAIVALACPAHNLFGLSPCIDGLGLPFLDVR
jgi:hypothetical protein